jgi:IS30 family transposase
MQEKANTKMITGSKNKDLSTRDAYIIEKSKKGFTPTEILTMMKRDGFVPVARSRIYQILERKN